ncbi:hypothetical protein [Saccharothrix syringae]|uniref:Uncharacterized protein n=1 Tax=Saccharothrix syringae TaxID=103733 RepID=A0A5Q0H2R2_SACSY|nr:hypothetical protein [Saccharothrix syringae]QFZ20481.1 hypothetical protein EKG83_26455 [Saccharothrix syringae]
MGENIRVNEEQAGQVDDRRVRGFAGCGAASDPGVRLTSTRTRARIRTPTLRPSATAAPPIRAAGTRCPVVAAPASPPRPQRHHLHRAMPGGFEFVVGARVRAHLVNHGGRSIMSIVVGSGPGGHRLVSPS